MEREHTRREDALSYKIRFAGTLAGSLLAIGAVVIAFGNTKWQTIENARTCEARLETRIQQTEKDNVQVKEQLRSIDERTKMIWEAVRK